MRSLIPTLFRGGKNTPALPECGGLFPFFCYISKTFCNKKIMHKQNIFTNIAQKFYLSR